ncbi:hypothetical protein [Mycolicibacterium vaccae]|uniref:hypothetical protein n=1 Tax=Mycolicibacterium vaccae TaxID=1810 RepID=UPI003CFC1145
MSAIATKFKVTTAALAVGASAAFTPVVASAAPATPVPAAPVQQVVGSVSEAPGDFFYYASVISLQIAASSIRFRSAVLDNRAERLRTYAARFPDTAFGRWAAAAAVRVEQRRAAYGAISFSACRDGQGVSVGPYGTVTRGAC